MYLLGASLTQETTHQDAADALLELAPRERKLHWRDLGDHGQRRILELIPHLGLEHIIVIASPLGSEIRQERARGQCVERLLWELVGHGVDHVTFESRTPHQDKFDRRRIDGLRSRHQIPRSFYADWVPGPTEPLLWLPDLILGIVGHARANGLDLPASIANLVTEIQIEL